MTFRLISGDAEPERKQSVTLATGPGVLTLDASPSLAFNNHQLTGS